VTRLPARTLLAYAAPALGFGFMSQLVSTYFMKYATDVLGVSAALMGAIFLLSRAWDAVADPIVGFLSDRTRSRWGRRRPWMLAGALPAAAAFAVLWAPPLGLTASGLAIWTGLALALSLTSQTAVRMPHEALGAELSRDYHERNRIFAAKRALFGVGALLVLVVLLRVGDAEDPRREIALLLIPLGVLGAGLVALACFALREPSAHLGRGPAQPLAALRDLLANPHARRLLAVMLLQQVATGAITTSAAYHAQYVLGDRDAFPKLLGCFFLATLVSLPLWIRLGRRFDKQALLIASMSGVGLILGAMFFVQRGDHALLFSLAAAGGLVAGALDVLFPSLQADVIDWDELRTGERKEGVYFAAWHLAEKLALGIAAAATGATLTLSGFVPNAEQGPSALLALRLLFSAGPLICYGAGAWLFLGFGLDRAAHARVQREIARGALAASA